VRAVPELLDFPTVGAIFRPTLYADCGGAGEYSGAGECAEVVESAAFADGSIVLPSRTAFCLCGSLSQKVRGHNLCWHEQLPSWFCGDATKANAQNILTQHIQTVAGDMRGGCIAGM